MKKTRKPKKPPKVTKAAVTRALTALGDTPGEVFRTLRAGGHKGPPASPSCPVAHYLRAALRIDDRYPPTAGIPADAVRVGGEKASVKKDQGAYWCDADDLVRVALPGPVREFVAAFDAGKYKSLQK